MSRNFGEVGRDDVRILDEALHGLAHPWCVGTVDTSVVTHHGIDNGKRLWFAELTDEVATDVYLVFGAKKPRHDTVEEQSELVPLIHI